MADYSQWFDGDDVANVLRSLKVWPSAGDTSPDGSDLEELFQEQADQAAESTVSEIEIITGRKPFLVTRATLAHTATNGDGVLQLLVPAKTIYSVTSGGTAIDSTTYWTQPATATLTGQPIEAIQFSTNLYSGGVWTRPNQIVIDADFGSYSSVPPALWKAGLGAAAFEAIVSIQGESDLSSISEDGFSQALDLVGPIDDKTRMKYWPDRLARIASKLVRQVA